MQPKRRALGVTRVQAFLPIVAGAIALLAVPGTAVALPDLTVTSLSATPTAVEPGGSISVTDTVLSTGGATGTVVVRYYLSTDQTITTADTYIGDRIIASLASGVPSTVTTTLAVLTSLNGARYIGAIVDINNSVAESDETNNKAVGNSIDISKVDLTVTSMVLLFVQSPLGLTWSW